MSRFSRHLAKGLELAEKQEYEEALNAFQVAINCYKTQKTLPNEENISYAFSGGCYCCLKLGKINEAVELSEEFRCREITTDLQKRMRNEPPPNFYRSYQQWAGEYKAIQEFSQVTALESFSTLYFMLEPRLGHVAVVSIAGKARLEWEYHVPFEYLQNLEGEYNDASISQNRRKVEEIINALSEILLPYPEQLNASQEILLIVPDPLVGWVPWELLKYKDTYLGLQFAIAISNSLELARIAISQSHTTACLRAISSSKSAVLFGDPRGDLKYSADEVEEASSLLSSGGIHSRVFSGQEVSNDNFRRYRQVDVLHYAGHAIFDPDRHAPDQRAVYSGLVMLDRWFDHLITATDIGKMQYERGPLIVLNACESGRLKRIGGELSGLVPAFIYAGATAVLATKWLASDDSARLLVLAFYDNLLRGKSAAIALRDARRSVSQQSYMNIFDWSCHTLYGDPFDNPLLEDEITDLDVFMLLTYVGGPDHWLSDNALMTLDEVADEFPELITSNLVEGFSEVEDWDHSSWARKRVLWDRLRRSISGDQLPAMWEPDIEVHVLYNIAPIEDALFILLQIDEEENPLIWEALEPACKLLSTIAERYLVDDPYGELMRFLDRLIDLLGEEITDGWFDTRECLKEILLLIGSEYPKQVSQRVVKAADYQWRWQEPESYLDILVELHNYEDNPDALMDFLIDEFETIYLSKDCRKIVYDLEEEVREEFISRLGVDQLRFIAKNSGQIGVSKMDKGELETVMNEWIEENWGDW